MALWTELHYSGNSPQIGAEGLATVRTLRSTRTPEASLTEAAENSVLRGQEHPRIPGLVCDGSVFIPDGHGCTITASYKPSEFLEYPIENIAEPEYIDIDTTFEDTDVTIPIYQKVKKTFGEIEGTPVEREVYQRVSNIANFRYSRTVHRISLNAEIISFGGVDTQLLITQYINTQTNKLHKINGVWMLFNADGVRRLEKDKYQFTYRWTFDPGIPNTLNFPPEDQDEQGFAKLGQYYYPLAYSPARDGEPDEFVPPHPTDDLLGWIAVPYHRTDVAGGANPEQAPFVARSPQYTVGSFAGSPAGTGDGYLGLPGIGSP